LFYPQLVRDNWYLGVWDRKIIGSNGLVDQGSVKIGVTQIERSRSDRRTSKPLPNEKERMW
jgi:hypothetical protein